MRLLADATKEKDESHAGKVVERSWYQRNKHIFPASRWEVSVGFEVLRVFDALIASVLALTDSVAQVFDPEKSYGKYTISGV